MTWPRSGHSSVSRTLLPSLPPGIAANAPLGSPTNGAARLVRKTPADHLSGPCFALHVGDFGSGDVTVVRAYRVITMASTLSYAILERPRPGQTAVLQDESGIHSLLHLADTEDDAARWLDAHPHRNARIVPAGAPEPRLFTYLQDPGHGWLIVSGADLAAAGMTRADLSICSYVSGNSLALEEDCDMPLFLCAHESKKMAPENGSCFSTSCACIDRPSKPRRISFTPHAR